jgi:hypothetical protein
VVTEPTDGLHGLFRGIEGCRTRVRSLTSTRHFRTIPHGAGVPIAGGRGVVAGGQVDRRRRGVAEAAGIDRVEGRAVTTGEHTPQHSIVRTSVLIGGCDPLALGRCMAAAS